MDDDALRVCREAMELRRAAQDWGEHIADDLRDLNDTACKRRWKRLAEAALAFAQRAAR